MGVCVEGVCVCGGVCRGVCVVCACAQMKVSVKTKCKCDYS